MKTTTTVSAALALLAAHPAIAQDDNSTYLDSVCSPEGDFASGSVPPCIDIISIEGACAPNGTDALALEAHAQCICNGSYFTEWLGCRQCLFEHGGLSERDIIYYKEVISSASNLLCTGTPTAVIQTLFTNAAAAIPIPTTGATVTSDAAPSDTAVSLYYTASGSQGAGQITGSATAATATGSVTTDAASTGTQSSSVHTTGTKTSGNASSVKSSATTTSSSTAAAATGIVGANGFLLAVAGGALMAAL